MQINNYQPGFHGKYNINIKNKPDEIAYLFNLSLNPRVELIPAKNEGDINEGGLNYIAEVPEKYDEYFFNNLQSNNIRFNKMV